MLPIIELLKSHLLPRFPSGSSINYRDEKLYLVGEHATDILILDKEYHEIDSKRLLNFPGKRIPKPVKPDLEASTFISPNGENHLLILGSASTPKREKIFLIPYPDSGLDVAHAREISDIPINKPIKKFPRAFKFKVRPIFAKDR